MGLHLDFGVTPDQSEVEKALIPPCPATLN